MATGTNLREEVMQKKVDTERTRQRNEKKTTRMLTRESRDARSRIFLEVRSSPNIVSGKAKRRENSDRGRKKGKEGGILVQKEGN